MNRSSKTKTGSFKTGARSLKTTTQHRRGGAALLVLLMTLGLAAGCFRDPNVRKHKYLESGQRYNSQGKYKEAVIQLSNAIKIDKNFADAHYELSKTYTHMGSFSAAYTELLRTVDLAPANVAARLDLGSLLLAGGKPDDAQVQAKTVLAAQPDNADAHALLARIAARRGQRDVALAEIHRALELKPNDAVLHETLAWMNQADPTQKDLVEAELKKSVALEPTSLNARLLLANFFIRNSRWDEARQAAQGAIGVDGKNVPARETLAQAYFRQGDTANGEQVLRQGASDLADNPQGVLMFANYLMATGQADRGRQELAALAQKFPNNVVVQEGYVRALLGAKDYSTAQTVVSGLMKDHGKDPQVAALNGIVLLNSGKPNDAVNALESAASQSPKDAFTQFWLGKAALAEGNSSLAEKSFHEAAQLNPAGLEAEEELARIAVLRGDSNALSEVADKTIAAAPRSPAGYVWRASVELNRKSPDKAEADLKTAIAVAPKNPAAYLTLGQLRFAQKKLPEGEALLHQALDLDPNLIAALRGLVQYDLYKKQPDAALALLNQQIAKSPKNSLLYDMLAQFEIGQKHLDQAQAAAQKAMQLNPDDGEAVGLYSQLQVHNGQTAAAIDAWQQFANSHPNSAAAFAILGTLKDGMGDWRTAEDYYKKALQIQPRQPIAANNLAYRMLEHGENVDVALTLAQTARQASPNSPNTADTLAWAYYYKGTYGFARDLLEEACRADQNNADLQYHLGMVYAKLHDKPNAQQHLKKAQSLAPTSQTAKDAAIALQGLG